MSITVNFFLKMVANNPLVSVAMASYNGEKYIGEQLDSIINQTYTNLEIVIVDDGSKDNTINIIKDYQTQYPFIFLFINDTNKGVTKAFERAVVESKGVFIAFCDQDDIWMVNKIETLVNEIGEHDAVYANSQLIDANGNSLGSDFNSIMKMQSYYSGTPFLLSNTVPGHAVLAKAGFLKNILPFPKELFFDLWIAFNAGGNNGIKFVDKVLVKYRQHESNTVGTSQSTNKKQKKTAQQHFDIKLQELKALATASIKDKHTKEVLAGVLKHFNKSWSLQRSLFFFKNYNDLLVSKNKPTWRKKLYCLKMIFKANY